MGAAKSVTLRPEEVADLQSESSFSRKEIDKLFERFQKLDLGAKGAITGRDFLRIPELAMNPLAHRIVAVLDANNQGEVNFREFVRALSVFSEGATAEAKIKFAFGIYDVDGDGFISEADLLEVLQALIGSNMDEARLKRMAHTAVTNADSTGEGKLGLADFSQCVYGPDLKKQLTISFL